MLEWRMEDEIRNAVIQRGGEEIMGTKIPGEVKGVRKWVWNLCFVAIPQLSVRSDQILHASLA